MSANLQRLLLAVFLALIYSPLAALLLDLPQATLPGFRWALLARSAALSAAVALFCGAVALVAAVSVWRRPHTPRWLPWLAVGMAIFQGWLAAGWVEGMAFLPLAFCLSLLALSTADPRLVDPARLSRPPLTVLRRVVLPLAAPPWLAGVSLIFVLSLADYTVPSLFSTATYALGIFAEFSAGGRPGTTLLLAAPLLAVCTLALAAVHAPLRGAALQRRHAPASLAGSFPLAWRLLELAVWAVCLLSAAVALLGLLRAIASPPALVEAATSSTREIANSFSIAGVAALAALPPALAAARFLVRPGRLASLLWLIILLPLAVPAPLTGIGLVTLWNHTSTGAVYGSAAMPVLAALARFLPIAALLLAAFLLRLDPLLEDAARLFRPNRTTGFVRVTLPLLGPGLLASAGAVFALALGELGATLVVAPPGMTTLALRIYNYLHYGASETVASLCLITAAATLGCAFLVTRLVRS
ncbi:MAG: ABC transporter permease subunit [Acidobacteria bacterium]|nr:ABC transporter permease subunit [Acidobacteriota bacterium]